MNPLWLIVLLGGGALYLSKLKATGDSLSITILNVETFKIVNGAIQLAINVALDNPTNTSIIIKKPNIKAYYQDNEVGNSLPSEERIKIDSNSRTVMKNINIQIPFSNLPSVVLSLFTGGEKKKLSIDIEVSTEVNGIPITKRQTISV
jgi:LEA14-like dessication related protein